MSSADWVVYDYEVDMLKQTIVAIGNGNKYPQSIQNAIVESMLLYLRILVDILLSRGSGNDDINLTELLPRFTSPLIDQLKTAYGDNKTVGSPCWTLNKMLAHPTQVRSRSYNYDHVLKALVPHIMQLLGEIVAARQVSP